MELFDIDTMGPYPESLGGSRCVIVFVDSTSYLQRPCGTQGKNTPVIVAIVKRFVVDMEVHRAFRTENDSKYINRTFAEYYDGLGIRRELTPPYTPKHNGPMENALVRTIKARWAVRLKVNKIFPAVHLGE